MNGCLLSPGNGEGAQAGVGGPSERKPTGRVPRSGHTSHKEERPMRWQEAQTLRRYYRSERGASIESLSPVQAGGVLGSGGKGRGESDLPGAADEPRGALDRGAGGASGFRGPVFRFM